MQIQFSSFFLPIDLHLECVTCLTCVGFGAEQGINEKDGKIMCTILRKGGREGEREGGRERGREGWREGGRERIIHIPSK